MTGRRQDGLLLLSRLLLAAALLPTGIARALNVSGFALALAGAGMPSPNAAATAAVVVQVFGPLALILGVLPRLTGFLMAGFAAATAVLLHGFWAYAGAGAVAERTLFLADLGLAGGFLIYAMAGPGAWSWQGWRLGAGLTRAHAAPDRAAGRPEPAGATKAGPARQGTRPKRARGPARAAA